MSSGGCTDCQSLSADGQHAGLGHHSMWPEHVQTRSRVHAHLALRTAATRASWSGRAAAASAGQPACCRKRRSWSALAAARSASASAVCKGKGESPILNARHTQAWCKPLQAPPLIRPPQPITPSSLPGNPARWGAPPAGAALRPRHPAAVRGAWGCQRACPAGCPRCCRLGCRPHHHGPQGWPHAC